MDNFRFEVFSDNVGKQGQTKRQSVRATEKIVILHFWSQFLHREIFPALDRVPKPAFVDYDWRAVAGLLVVQMIIWRYLK